MHTSTICYLYIYIYYAYFYYLKGAGRKENPGTVICIGTKKVKSHSTVTVP